VRVLSAIMMASCALLAAGCSGVPGTNSTGTISNSVQGTALQGKVNGGQQAIVGAHVYLFAVNTTAYGDASLSLLTSGTGRTKDGNGNYYVTSQSGGSFNISGEFTCPNANSQVYLYSIGGNTGGGTNSAAGLLAGLGTCGNLSDSQYIVINEVSTVVTAYAIAGFATDATDVSSSSSGQAAIGVANAFLTIGNLETQSTGLVPTTTTAGDGAVPQKEIYTLANIIAACVSTTGPPGGTCGTLFSDAKNGANAPTDTATAAINIAHNPGTNVGALFLLQTANPPYQPALTTAPNDFTLAVTYTGGGLDGTGQGPETIAIDGSGNIFVPNYTSNSISKFSPLGAILSGTGGYTGGGLDNPTAVAADIYGNIWSANFSGDNASEFSSKGVTLSIPPGFTGGGLNNPYGIAINSSSEVWIVDSGGNALTEFTSEGTADSPSSGFSLGAAAAGPSGAAVDTSGNIWVTNTNAVTSSIIKAVPSATPGVAPTTTNYEGGGLNSPYGIAIDGSGDIWITNQGGNGSLSEFGPNGSAITQNSVYTGGGLYLPFGIAIDGLGNVWVANKYVNCISEFNSGGNAVSPSTGYTSAELNGPYGIAVDPSGNVWVTTDNSTASLTEFIGLAAPVVTPLQEGVVLSELGTRP
jgi:streptogramin lyase